MEIEAKFAVLDIDAFLRLQTIDQLVGFALLTSQVKAVRDTYLDTPDRRIQAAGYACRQREEEKRILITLKALERAEGAIHRREEVEMTLPGRLPFSQWPDGPVRDRVCAWIDDAPLAPLFTLEQTRMVRGVELDGRSIAEWSLDEVHLTVGEREQVYFELEIELADEGTEEDLEALTICLQETWGLKLQPRSKFERALAVLEEEAMAEKLLTPQDRALCEKLATREDMYRRRAAALLALDEGTTQAEAGERADLSARRVRYWLAEFRERRLSIFPDRVLDGARSALEASAPPESPSEPNEVASAQPLEELFDRHRVDREHAHAVVDHALALFDHLQPIHGLPTHRRSLLETAALVHNIGLNEAPNRHHKAGRDILLSSPPAGLSPHESLMVALTTFLHRKRITPKKLRKLETKFYFADLPPALQEEALALAALVRLADGLDYSQTGSSVLKLANRGERRVEFEVTGFYANVDAARAQKKSDLWRLLFDTTLHFVPVRGDRRSGGGPAEESALPIELSLQSLPEEMPEKPGLFADDTMAEAARKTFAFHFQRMIFHEPGTRLGEDIEELHDMRVASRRMRSAFRVFGDFLNMKELKPMLKGLRRTGRRLGTVRDLDVFWEKTQHYLDELPEAQQSSLAPLHEVWEAERESARQKMLNYLDGERYVRFKERFAARLQTPEGWSLPGLTAKGEALPRRLKHVVPMVVHERLADVLAYDEWVTQPGSVPLERLHRLRIAAKRLRYTLEFFEEVLAPQARDLIKEIKKLQDHLGDLQDAVVASELLRDFLTWGTWGHGKKKEWPTEPVVAPGVAAYLATRQTEIQHLLEAFPQVWVYFQSLEFKQAVAVAVAPL